MKDGCERCADHNCGALKEGKGHIGKGWKKKTPACSSSGIFYLAPRAEWFSLQRKLELEADSFSPFPSFSKTARTFSPVPLLWRGAPSTIIFLIFFSLQVPVAGISGGVSVQKTLHPPILCSPLGDEGWAEGKLCCSGQHLPPSIGSLTSPLFSWAAFPSWMLSGIL